MLRGELALLSGFDSNPLRRDATVDRIHAPVLRLLPRLHLHTPSPGALDLTFGAMADLRVNLDAPDAPEPPDASGVDAHLRLRFAPHGPFTVTLFDSVRRSSEPTDRAITVPVSHTVNHAGVELSLHGRSPVAGLVSYENTAAGYSERADADYTAHMLRGVLRWQFARRGVLDVSLDQTFHAWSEPAAIDATPDQRPLRVSTGIEGQMTRYFFGGLRVGYGDSLSQPAARFQHVIGELEAGWLIGGSGTITLSLTRDFRTSTWGGYYIQHRLSLRSYLELGSHVTMALDAEWSPLNFAEFQPSSDTMEISHAERTGELIGGHASIRVVTTKWLRLSLHYRLDMVRSNFRSQVVAPTTVGIRTDLTIWNYVRHEAFFGVAAGF